MAEVGVGRKVPYFELPDQQGYPWSLSGELEVGPVVLIFYRGDWCAYCNGQLAGYSGSDPPDRPDEEEVFAALKGLDTSIERITGGPEFVVAAPEARQGSVRPDKAPMPLDQLLTYYGGALSATVALAGRFGAWGRSGRKAFGAVSGYQAMLRAYREALEDTARLQREEG